MAQITLRPEDQKANELRLLAQREDRSVNAIPATLVDVLLDPTTASNREQELYERLVRAGLIDPQNTAQGAGRKPPSRREVSAARAALAGGRLASDIVSDERG